MMSRGGALGLATTRWSRGRLAAALFPVACAAIYALLDKFRRAMLYHPRTYDEQYGAMVVEMRKRLRYHGLLLSELRVSEEQVVYFVGPVELSERWRSWILFGGNAMTALDWLAFVDQHARPDVGFLLVDYPGYGASSGSPTERGMAESATAGVEALWAALRAEGPSAPAFGNLLGDGERPVAPWSFPESTSILGHSIGASTALKLAVAYQESTEKGSSALRLTGSFAPPLERVVLSAPFSSIPRFAHRLLNPFGFPLWVYQLLVREHFDNLSTVAQLRGVPMTIIHGKVDNIVPVQMGKDVHSAASIAGLQAELVLDDNAGHNDLLNRTKLYR